jgi:transaldolase/glucose-6-phosphate isomerase
VDDLRREMFESGELRSRIAAGQLQGMTSNPTIFDQAIGGSEVYTPALRPMAQAGWPTDRILDSLIADDIREAADLFRPVYEASQGGDGFVSLEVHPALADETDSTLEEVRRLWALLNRPNVMIKIPATSAGVPAIRRAVAEGMNVNITLIFSLKRYAEVIEAYLSGLEERQARGGALDHIASVASFFVSRVDTEVDERLEAIVRQEGAQAERAASLRGQAAIANAVLAYAQFQAAFASERFGALAAHGARVQRPLWASTSTKNPAYPDTYYIENLIGAQTVNTMPLKTLDAFLDHGRAERTMVDGLSTARSRLEALASVGVSMDEVTDLLERQGVKKFSDSFTSLQKTVQQRAEAARHEIRAVQPRLQELLDRLDRDDVGRRLWGRDTSLWPGQAKEWLGWLDLPERITGARESIEEFARQAVADGFQEVVLLGMGGSSLAAEVLSAWSADRSGLDIAVLDTVEPSEVARVAASVKYPLFIVASKSGTTVEPQSLMEYFWAAQGGNGKTFAAITDPGSPLQSVAVGRGFRKVFLAPPDVGGRYSALSVFGMLPAALAGVDLAGLAAGASTMSRRSGPNIEAARSPGLFLGALLAAAWSESRDKVTLIADPPYESFLSWTEQLLAESSGKDGKGLYPIAGEPPTTPRHYGPDRMMIYLRADGGHDARVEQWIKAGIPVAILSLRDSIQDLGAEFFRWELATAIACHIIGVNAFDQPDVQRAKDAARRALKGQGREARKAAASPSSPSQAFAAALADLREGDALALLAFLPRTPAARRSLVGVRRRVRDRKGNATIVGFGPGYLHSTGQLFKGGPDRMVAVVLLASAGADLEVPGTGHTLRGLLRAQAEGDVEAMRALGRRVHFIPLTSARGLADLTKAASSRAKPTSKRSRRSG